MATVTVYTAARMKQIEDNSVTNAEIIDGELILRRYDGSLINAGSVGAPEAGLTPKGMWDISVEYVIGDLVVHNGSSWVSSGTTTGDEPGVEPVWQELLIELNSFDEDGDLVNQAGVKVLPYSVGDLALAEGVYDIDPDTNTGRITGGQIASATGLQIIQGPYHQTQKPGTDRSVGNPLLIQWDALIDDNSDGYGPNANPSSLYGPSGTVSLEGHIRQAKSNTSLTLMPLGYAHLLRWSNLSGVPIDAAPAWGFMDAEMLVADGATVRHIHNDFAKGGASFVDSKTFLTANNGEWDGLSYSSAAGSGAEVISFLSSPFFLGNTHIDTRTAFKVKDANHWGHLGSAEDLADGFAASIDGDPGRGTVQNQVGLYIPRLLEGVVSNIGIWNGSATVEEPRSITLTTSTDNISPIDTTVLHLNNTSGDTLTITSTPTIPSGYSDGQKLSLVNVGEHAVRLQGHSSLAGSLLASTRLLNSGATLNLRWVSSMSRWVGDNAELDTLSASGTFGKIYAGPNEDDTDPTIRLRQASSTKDQITLGFLYDMATIGFGGEAQGVDTFITNPETNFLSFNNAGIRGIGRGIQLSEQLDPSAPGANNAVVFARDDGLGNTQLSVRFPTGAVQEIATQGAAARPSRLSIDHVTDDSYTAVVGDVDRMKRMDNADENSFIIPALEVPTGSVLAAVRWGVGNTLLVPDDIVLVSEENKSSFNGDMFRISSTYGTVQIIKMSEQVWLLTGAVEAY